MSAASRMPCSLLAKNVVPRGICACTAAITSGWQWPMNIGPEPNRKSTYSLPLTSHTRAPRPSRITMSPARLPKLPAGNTRRANSSNASSSSPWGRSFIVSLRYQGRTKRPAARVPIAEQNHQHGHHHETDRTVEYPAWQAMVHEPAAEHRPDCAADVETGGDNAEYAPRHARWCRGAHQHVTRRHDHAGEKSRGRHCRQQQDDPEIESADGERDRGRRAKAHRRHLRMTARRIGDKAAGEHAESGGRKIDGQSGIRGGELHAVQRDECHDRKCRNGARRQAQQ